MSDEINMSDDDFLDLPLPDDKLIVQREHDEDTDAHSEEVELAKASDESDAEVADDTLTADGEATDDADTTSETDNTDADTDTTTDVSDTDADTDTSTDTDKGDAADATGDTKTDAELSTGEANWNALTAPFRANNTDMKVDTPEEARKLMSMGANYHKKMIDMKEDRKNIETLRDNDLLAPDKLDLLIAASKGKPEAIAKLLSDHSINPMDLQVEGASDYKAESYQVTNETVNLRDVLSGIRDTPSYEKTMKVVGEVWDSASQDAILGKPSVISNINDHMASGVYDLISAEVSRQRMFNPELSDLNDITAYIQVGNEMEAAGKFKQADTATAEVTPKAKPKPVPKKVVDSKADAARRSASAPKQNAAPSKLADTSKMNDDEFEAYFKKHNQS